MVKEIGHFIGGKTVAGKSGRFADVYDPTGMMFQLCAISGTVR